MARLRIYYTFSVNFSVIALRQILTSSGRSNQFSAVERSMFEVVFDILSDTAPWIFGMMASTLDHPRSDRLCAGVFSSGIVWEGIAKLRKKFETFGRFARDVKCVTLKS
jgi:hypothetical protein